MITDSSLCLINNIPTPYRRALFDEIVVQAKDVAIDVSVMYLAKTETVRDWSVELRNYETVLPRVLQIRNHRTPTSDVIVNFGYLVKTVRPHHVILFGYNYPTYLVVAFVRAILRRPTYLFCETTLADSSALGWKKTLKSILLRSVFDKFVVPGSRSAEYLIAHGVSQAHIHFARNSSNLRPNERLVPEQAPELRLLYVGRLSPEKKIIEFSRTFSKLGGNHRLTIVGDGPDAGEITALAEAHPRIEMLGAMSSDQLPKIFERHHVLVLVSDSEPWGLVVNEAVNFGLALLLSRQVGSAPELLDGNGRYLEEITVDQLETMLEDIELHLVRYREQSLRIAADSTVQMQAAGFLSLAKDSDNEEI